MTTNDTRTARERAEEMAAEKFPDAPVDYTGLVRLAVKGDRRAFVVGFLARDAEPTTVTAEQIEKAAYTLDPPAWDDVFLVDLQRFHGEIGSPAEKRKNRARSNAAAAFRAAGFRIEGDPA